MKRSITKIWQPHKQSHSIWIYHQTGTSDILPIQQIRMKTCQLPVLMMSMMGYSSNTKPCTLKSPFWSRFVGSAPTIHIKFTNQNKYVANFMELTCFNIKCFMEFTNQISFTCYWSPNMCILATTMTFMAIFNTSSLHFILESYKSVEKCEHSYPKMIFWWSIQSFNFSNLLLSYKSCHPMVMLNSSKECRGREFSCMHTRMPFITNCLS